MTNLDQFESLFNAAAHDAFGYRPLDVKRVLVVTDLEQVIRIRTGETGEDAI